MTESPLILIVDDEQSFRDIISVQLGGSGFRVAVAKDGEEALMHAEKLKPDLILLDMKMPVMDGADVLAKIKSREDLKNIKVIFLSNFGDPREEARAVDQHFAQDVGALDYINKSEIDTKLISKVKEALS